RSWQAAGLVLAAVLLTACSGSGDGNANLNARGAQVPLVTKAESVTDASRFLTQATFGPTRSEVDRVMAVNFDGWLEQEFAKPYTQAHLAYWRARLAAQPGSGSTDWLYHSFWRNALSADDALRQRVAFALSQIFVVSLNDMNVSQ